MQKENNKAYVVAVTMGYGHLRPAYNLRHMAYGGVLNADDYEDIPVKDKKFWSFFRRNYEFISRLKHIPLIGNGAFELMDELQEIENFYPRRDLTHPIWQLRAMMSSIKGGWGRHLIEKLNKNPLPLVTTFFAVAHMADYWKYKGPIYCIATDTDINRSWVAMDPKKSKIKYCAPSYRVMERLALYGVPKKNIFLTGFPLPKENLGDDTNLKRLNHDLLNRIFNLDPERRYLGLHDKHIRERLGLRTMPKKSDHLLTITFAVGGAGAQREIGTEILKSLKQKIIKKEIRLNLIAGINPKVNDYFLKQINKLRLCGPFDEGLVRVLFKNTKAEYFKVFDSWLRTTDILWTKPSELSFYAALGIPIIIAPPMGSQEDYNKAWLLTLDSGIPQEDPKYTAEWLDDWLKSGFLAKAAMSGYREAFKYGTYNIEQMVAGRFDKLKIIHTVSPY